MTFSISPFSHSKARFIRSFFMILTLVSMTFGKYENEMNNVFKLTDYSGGSTGGGGGV